MLVHTCQKVLAKPKIVEAKSRGRSVLVYRNGMYMLIHILSRETIPIKWKLKRHLRHSDARCDRLQSANLNAI